MAQTISFRDYPIFSLASDGQKRIVLSGGGGADHGIENFVECLEVDHNGKRIATVASDPIGLVDSICYCPKLDLFCGGLGRECIIFKVGPEKSYGAQVEILKRWTSVAPSTDELARMIPNDELPARKLKIKTQDHCAISNTGRYVATTGEDGCLRVFGLTFREGPGAEGIASETAIGVQELRNFPNLHKVGITEIAFSCDERLVITIGRDGKLNAVDLVRLEVILSTFVANPDRSSKAKNVTPRSIRLLSKVTELPDGRRKYYAIVAGHEKHGSTLMKWSLTCHPAGVASPTFTLLNSKLFRKVAMLNCIALGSNEEAIGVASNKEIWTMSTGSLRIQSHGRRGAKGSGGDLPATGIAFVDRDRRLVVASADYTITILNISSDGSLVHADQTKTSLATNPSSSVQAILMPLWRLFFSFAQVAFSLIIVAVVLQLLLRDSGDPMVFARGHGGPVAIFWRTFASPPLR